MTTIQTSPAAWPTDPDHCDAIDTLLVMAAAEERWGEPRRAVHLLDNVEQIVGTLPGQYQHMRTTCRGTPPRQPVA
ncbi:MAG TPA: hypothetical protein VHM72_08525 [Solirubrobacteraceae bacterium]|nr:hypothetical protein [Solirubrobacteraceae bacterium]